MNIDGKLDLFKNFVSENKLGKNNVQSNINQSMVASPEQKLLGMELPKESLQEKLKREKKEKEMKAAKKAKEEIDPNKNKIIERNPLALLRLF